MAASNYYYSERRGRQESTTDMSPQLGLDRQQSGASGTKRKRTSRSSSNEESSAHDHGRRRPKQVSSQETSDSHHSARRRDIPTLDNYVALDCEFVGVGPKGSVSSLGRCSIVDSNGKVLLDIYAKPKQPITDYRTRWSGIRPMHLAHAGSIEHATTRIKAALEGKIVVGHNLQSDFSVLRINHPASMIRDTIKYVPIRELAHLPVGQRPSLKNLAQNLLGQRIQIREHSSVEDARANMEVFKKVYEVWENSRFGPFNAAAA